MLKKNKKILPTLAALGILAAMLLSPRQALEAVRSACSGWWQNVLPALLPFFIITEVLTRSGLLRALSIWLEPLMQPLFRLPGAAALGLCMGFFAGSPTGGTVAASLRRQGLVTKNEGERLCAFCNNAGPLYILLTVTAALGRPGAAGLGIALILAHYPINLLLGIMLRFLAPKAKPPASMPMRRSPRELLRSGWQAFMETPALPLAQLLRQSALAALTNIAIIGAFMLIFSLVLLALRLSGLLRLLYLPLGPLLRLLGLEESMLPALAEGCFEMTLGISSLADCPAPLFHKLLAAAMILAWGGLSIHCQIAGVISDTDLSLRYYLPCRLIHTLAAPALLLFLAPRLSWGALAGGASLLPAWLLLPGITLLAGLTSLLLLLPLSLLLAKLAGRCQ